MNTRIPFIAGFLVVGVIHLQAATNTVTSTADSGAGTLRDALASAADGDTIDATGVSGTILLTSGELLVSNSVTILGPGPANLAVDGNFPNTTNRLFHVMNAVTASISSLTITNGRDAGGGGIWNDHAALTVSNITMSRNAADSGGGIYNDGSSGGSATLTVNNSTLSGNSAKIGGGIVNETFGSGSAILQIVDSTLSGNSASNDGGGIYIFEGAGATVKIVNSTLSGNSATFGLGGGILNARATLTVSNCTLSGNSAGLGGGILNDALTAGSASLQIVNSTLSDNSANSGGGIVNLAFGGSANVQIGSTILNAGASGENIFNSDGTVTSLGYNLSSDDGGGALTNTADQINTNAMLGPLQDNGGPTFTHALLTGSPAINAGDPGFTSPPNFDQRGPGFPRVVGGRIDIGAVEVPLADLVVTKLAVKTKLKGKTQLTYTIPVQNFGPDPATGVVLTDPLPAGTAFLSVSSTQGTNSAPPVGSSGTVTCNLGSLSNGVTATVTIEVTITAKGKATITNTATVTSDTPDPTPGNNSATIQTSTTGK